ncbi:hypothetical protein C8R46DRAFT_1208764 [Mycena filopes]|nr:hypothetical protein C8R46DRAFT_1208764 [Mycena filopes]
MADSILKHEKVLLGELYRWHYKSNGHNHRDPKPVEFMGNPHPPPTFVKASLKAAVEFFRPKASREDSVTTPPQSLLTAFYDVDVQLLHVATLGNIRALLGRPQTPIGGSVKYDVHVLSAHDNPDPDEESHTKAGADITSTIKIRQGDFLVMLTPWISKCLTNEEVVGLVGIWLAKNRPIEGDEAAPSASTTGILPEELPVDLKDDETLMFRRWGVPKRFINEDAEVATHLVHNAMGGADKRLRELLLGFEAQDSGGTTESFAVAIILFK